MILGRWQIRRWEQSYDDGRMINPMGTRLEGFIQYDEDERMCCFIARADSPKFMSGGQWDASDAEKVRAYESCLSYAGRYRIDGDQIEHMVEFSLFPNWKGGTQIRKASFAGDELRLTARLEEGTPQARTASLAWTRFIG